MRSYWMSLTFVAILLLGYTAIVFNSHSELPLKSETPHASAEIQPREPAATQSGVQAAQQARDESVTAD